MMSDESSFYPSTKDYPSLHPMSTKGKRFDGFEWVPGEPFPDGKWRGHWMGLTFTPDTAHEPNWFRRTFSRLLLGVEWRKVVKL